MELMPLGDCPFTQNPAHPLGLHRLHEFRIILGRRSQPSQFGQRTLCVIGGRHLIRVQSLARHPNLLYPQPVGIQSDRLSDDFLTKLPFIGDQLRMSGGAPFEQHPDGQRQVGGSRIKSSLQP